MTLIQIAILVGILGVALVGLVLIGAYVSLQAILNGIEWRL